MAEEKPVKQYEGPWVCQCGQNYSADRLLCELCGNTRWWMNATPDPPTKEQALQSEIDSLKAQLAAKDAELSEANARIGREATQILNISDTLRSRGFTGRQPLDERVIAMAQALDAATAQLAAKDEMLQSIGVACGFPVVLNVEQLTETIKKHIARIHRELAAKDEEIAAAFAAALDAHITDDGTWVFGRSDTHDSECADGLTVWLSQRRQGAGPK